MCLIYPDHSEPEDGEVWNEDEAVICADLCEDEPDFDSNMETVPSTFGIFSWWLLHFLMYMQAVFHLRCGHHQSFAVLSCLLYCPWPALCCWN